MKLTNSIKKLTLASFFTLAGLSGSISYGKPLHIDDVHKKITKEVVKRKNAYLINEINVFFDEINQFFHDLLDTNCNWSFETFLRRNIVKIEKKSSELKKTLISAKIPTRTCNTLDNMMKDVRALKAFIRANRKNFLSLSAGIAKKFEHLIPQQIHDHYSKTEAAQRLKHRFNCSQ